MSLTVHEDSSDELDIRFIQVTSSLCVTENGLSQFRKFLKDFDEGQDPNFTLLRDLHLLHLPDLSRLRGKIQTSTYTTLSSLYYTVIII